MQDPGAGVARRRELRVVVGHRGGSHDLGSGRRAAGAMAYDRLDPGGAQLGQVARVGLVGARDLRPERAGDQGQGAHSRPADGDEVQSPSGEGRGVHGGGRLSEGSGASGRRPGSG